MYGTKFSIVFPNHLDPTSNQTGGDGTSALHVAAAGRNGDQAGQDAVAQGANVILVRDDISWSADIHPSYLFHLSNLSSLSIVRAIHPSIRPSIHPSIHLHHLLLGLEIMNKPSTKSIFLTMATTPVYTNNDKHKTYDEYYDVFKILKHIPARSFNIHEYLFLHILIQFSLVNRSFTW